MLSSAAGKWQPTIVILNGLRVQLLRHRNRPSREVRVVGHPLPDLYACWLIIVPRQQREDVVLST